MFYTLPFSYDFFHLHSSFQRSKKEAKGNGTYTYTSIEKLLSNKFARQVKRQGDVYSGCVLTCYLCTLRNMN